MTQMAEFRLAIMSTCTHNGPVFHYKAYMDVYWQWEQYQVATAKLELLLAPFHQSWIYIVNKITLEKQTNLH